MTSWRWAQVWIAAMTLLTVFGLALDVLTADLGCEIWTTGDKRFVATVDSPGAASAAGLAPGDEVLADPIPLPPTERGWAEWLAAAHEAHQSGRVTLRIRRQGVERTVVVATQERTSVMALRRLRSLAPSLPALFGFLAVALVLARRPAGPDLARLLTAVAFATSAPVFAYADLAPGWPVPLLVVGDVVSNLLAPLGNALGVWFFAIFPSRRRAANGIAFLAIAEAIAVGGLVLLVDAGLVAPPFEVAWLVLDYKLGTLGAMVVLAIWQRARAENAVARRQASWLGFVIASTVVVTAVLDTWPSTLSVTVGSLWNALVPLGIAAIVTRFKLFALDSRVPVAGTQALMITASLLVYLGVLALADLGARTFDGGTAMSPFVAGVAVVLLAEPLRALARRAIDRLFSNDRAQFRERIARLVSGLNAVSAGELLSHVAASLEASEAAWVSREALGPGAEATLARMGACRTVELDGHAPVEALLARGIETLVAIPVEGDLRALGIGARIAGHLWGTERTTLATAGRAIGLALERLSAHHDLNQEVERHAVERQRIARDLHDGIGATLTAARLLTQLARQGDAPHVLSRLEGTLHDGMAELRAALWSIDPREVTWAELTARIRRHVADVCASAKLVLRIEIRGDPALRPAPAVKLALLRVAQEGLTNVVRHSAAQNVELELTAGAEAYELRLADDGGGADGSGPGLGLSNMRARLDELGGRLDLETVDGGFRIVARIPRTSEALDARASPERC